jgi:hypothetical protein
MNLAVVFGVDDKILLHKADCPVVRKAAADGFPTLTMFGAKEVPTEYEKHECLKEK